MSLIDFLLKNWIFVVIAYMAVSVVVKRMRPPSSAEAPPKKAPAKPARGMPPFGGGGFGWPGQPAETGMTKASKATRPAGSSAVPGSHPGDPGPKADPAYESPAARMERGESRRTLPAAPDGAVKTAERAEPLLSPQDAARGVLWAEILGPPRAKRPYKR
ncbi:hypothetical protein O9H85_01705 [Paenibacillus filicis]|uniref:Uncharacterized protein n=1 Tax=Paenibacillus gyeongsangnamensis TaxID=3388067 RepID=A0ABT4Q2R6_9BACL|nr:hypothetical protein [Paenibacillus filicis]MCZ8511173.1 hypothetical protein [Paenibacillus filicis]